MPPLDSPIIELEVLALAVVAIAEFISLLRWRIRIRRGRPNRRFAFVFFTVSDILVGGSLLVFFPLVYDSAWLALFEEFPTVTGLILLIALLLLTTGLGKALLLLFTRSRVITSA